MNGTYAPGTIRSNATWLAAPYSGLKTQVTAYQLVNSMEDLSKVSLNLSGVYALGRDLDASTASTPFEPIGLLSQTGFVGQFDGFRHAIKNLAISQNLEDGLPDGLFATIGQLGIVRNLQVLDASVAGLSGPVGILAGRSDGLISYASTSGSASGSSFGNTAGGLVGINTGVILRSGSSASASSNNIIGGLAGINSGTIIQSYATGYVADGSRSAAGGLVGDNSGLVRQSYSSGQVRALQSNGGLVNSNEGRIQESFAAEVFNGYMPPMPGGLASVNTGSIANDVFWDTQKIGQTIGVRMGTAVPDENGLTTAQMSMKASFGPTWNFGERGTWVIPSGYQHPILQWQLAN